MSVERVIVAPYSHSDWAWICYRRWHEKRYIRAFELVLDLMDAGTGFTWFIDSWHEQFGPIRENRPDLVERMKPHVAAGRFGLGPGMFTNPSHNICTREVLVRNVLLGQRRFRELFGDGVRFDMGSHIDMCRQHSQFPQMMRKMGFSAMMMGRPAAALDAQNVGRQFRWRGADGTELPVHRMSAYALFTHDPYDADSLANAITEELAKGDELGSGPTSMFLFGWDDDCLPLGEPCWQYDLFGAIERWNDEHEVKVSLGTPDEVAREMAGYADDLPLVEGCLDPAASGRVTENNHDNLFDLHFRAGQAAVQAERANMHYAADYPEAELGAMWEDILSFHPHAMAWLWKGDYEPMMLTAHSAERTALALRDRARRSAAERIRPAREGRPIVFFNPLAFDRTETCELLFALDEAGPTGFHLTDGDGNALPTQFVGDSHRGYGHGEDAGRMRCEWRIRTEVTVPANGHTVAYLSADGATQPATKFELSPTHLDVGPLAIDMPGGIIESVTHETLGELLDRLDIVFIETDDGQTNPILNRKENLTGRGDPTPWPPSPQWQHEWQNDGVEIGVSSFEVEDWSLIEAGPLGARVFATGSVAGNPTELEMFIHAADGRIDCEVRAYMLNPVCGYLLAEVQSSFEGACHVDVPFGVESRDMSAEPHGLEMIDRGHLKPFWGHTWADLSDGERGVAFLSQPGLIGYRLVEGTFQHILHKIIPPNRMVGARWANDSRSGLGRQRIKFSVLPHAGDWRTARLYREAEKWRQPIDGEDVLYPLSGDQPDTQRGLAVGPDNITLSAFFKDCGQTFLRIFENEGTPTRVSIDLPFPASSTRVCNLLGEPLDDSREITIRDTHVECHLGPWEILTLQLG